MLWQLLGQVQGSRVTIWHWIEVLYWAHGRSYKAWIECLLSKLALIKTWSKFIHLWEKRTLASLRTCFLLVCSLQRLMFTWLRFIVEGATWGFLHWEFVVFVRCIFLHWFWGFAKLTIERILYKESLLTPNRIWTLLVLRPSWLNFDKRGFSCLLEINFLMMTCCWKLSVESLYLWSWLLGIIWHVSCESPQVLKVSHSSSIISHILLLLETQVIVDVFLQNAWFGGLRFLIATLSESLESTIRSISCIMHVS